MSTLQNYRRKFYSPPTQSGTLVLLRLFGFQLLLLELMFRFSATVALTSELDQKLPHTGTLLTKIPDSFQKIRLRFVTKSLLWLL